MASIGISIKQLRLKGSNPSLKNITLTLLGMVCASFTILWMKIKLEWHSIVFCSFGGIFGLILGK